MSTALKSFRLPSDCIDFIEQEAKKKDISQSKVVTDAIKKKMDFQAQWQEALFIMANDENYQREQVEMAEENYD